MSIESYVRLLKAHVGLVLPMAFPEVAKGEGPIVERAARVLEDGFFGAIEVSWVKDDSVRSRLAELLGQSGASVVFCGGVPITMERINLSATDPGERAGAVLSVKRLIDEAYQLGARIFCMPSGPNVGPELRARATAALVESAGELCDYAAEQGKASGYAMTISLEPFDMDVDKRLLVGHTADAASVAAAVHRKARNFGLTVDLGHLPLLGEDPQAAVDAAGDALCHVHVGNCVMTPGLPAYGDQHPRFGIPGGRNTVKDLARMLAALLSSGYVERPSPTGAPVITFEVKPLPLENPEVVIASSKRAWRDACAIVAGCEET